MFFQTPSYSTPFLSADLMTFYRQAAVRFREEYNEEAVIYTPAEWNEEHPYTGDYTKLLEDTYEIVLLASPYSAPVGNMLPDEIAFLKQHPDKLFHNNGVVGGFIRSGFKPTAPEDDPDLFSGFMELTLENFLITNQMLSGQLQYKNTPQALYSKIYGNPAILSENVHNSTIVAPAFIDKNVTVHNSYIGAGTILTGDTTVTNSRIYGSFIHSSQIHNCERVEDALIATNSHVENQILTSPSALPYGSIVRGED